MSLDQVEDIHQGVQNIRWLREQIAQSVLHPGVVYRRGHPSEEG